MMGKNVFYSKESFIGHWKIIPAIKRNPDISRMIVVAIDNDGMGRVNEYAAWTLSKNLLFRDSSLAGGVECPEFVAGSNLYRVVGTTVPKLTARAIGLH